MTTPTHPYGLFDLHVLRSEKLGPSMVRITLGGPGLDGFASAGRDQRIKLFFPHPHQDAPVMPANWTAETWFEDWRAMDPAERGIMRSYTVRDQRPGELDIDFAMHTDGGSGPAASWASAAAPGARISVLGPTGPDNGGYDFRPPEAPPSFIAGDITALPAIAGNLAWLPAGTPTRVFVSVPHAEDRQDLPTKADAEIAWVPDLLGAVRAADVPDGAYVWIAGESATVKSLRRHMVNERGVHRRSVTFCGYWRRGASEEDLLAEYDAGKNPYGEE
ncbi:NADPH-dependent ferric siderophore reductase [Actinomadura sp. CNU-125]|uniref:siderophore-interacting protein n=1 Tax=Actinomadura sp. CNU-125 TaxID=1904961 RepID=UPI00096A1641|nr:siderophore-interacting protein [Actinomadura sp. CNU-125]OLT36988.1 NADPH-dependent ferric siderophore reductase [Actinomadura sp. CNU-125]